MAAATTKLLLMEGDRAVGVDASEELLSAGLVASNELLRTTGSKVGGEADTAGSRHGWRLLRWKRIRWSW